MGPSTLLSFLIDYKYMPLKRGTSSQRTPWSNQGVRGTWSNQGEFSLVQLKYWPNILITTSDSVTGLPDETTSQRGKTIWPHTLYLLSLLSVSAPEIKWFISPMTHTILLYQPCPTCGLPIRAHTMAMAISFSPIPTSNSKSSKCNRSNLCLLTCLANPVFVLELMLFHWVLTLAGKSFTNKYFEINLPVINSFEQQV